MTAVASAARVAIASLTGRFSSGWTVTISAATSSGTATESGAS